nr:MAG TPA: Chlororespiratory reduction 6 [Caudoviricetes sp.]
MSRDSGIRKDNKMNKKSLLAIIGLGAVSTTALIYNYLQWKSNKELEEQLDVLNEKLVELNNALDKYTNVEVMEVKLEVEEEQPKKSKVVPLYQPQVTGPAPVEQVEEVKTIVNDVNKQTEKRDEFLQQFEVNQREEKIIEVDDMKIDANSPQAFSIYKDSILASIVEEASRVDADQYREWTRDFYNLGHYDTANISTQDIIKQMYEMFDYPIDPDLWYDDDEQFHLKMLEQVENFFGTGTVYSDFVTYGNFIANTVDFLAQEYDEISKLEIAAIMLQQLDVFDPDTNASMIFDRIKDAFNHNLRTGYGYGVLAINEDNIGWFVMDDAKNAIRNEINDFNNYLYDNMDEV